MCTDRMWSPRTSQALGGAVLPGYRFANTPLPEESTLAKLGFAQRCWGSVGGSDKGGIAPRRKQAGWNDGHLLKALSNWHAIVLEPPAEVGT